MQTSPENQTQPEPSSIVPERGRAWRIIAIVLTLHAALLGGVVLIQGCGKSEQSSNTELPAETATVPEPVPVAREEGSAQAEATPLPGSETLTPEEHVPGLEPTPTPSPEVGPLAKNAPAPAADQPSEIATDQPAPEPVQPTTPAKTPPPIKHTVRKGDTLTKIARKHAVTVRDLAAANKLTSQSSLKLGQKLVVPVKNTALAKAGKAAPVQKQAGQTHQVRAGETPTSIAKRYGVSVPELLRTNHISDPRKIRVNQKLVIPVSQTASEATAVTPVASPNLQKEKDIRPTAAQEPAEKGQVVQGI